MAASRTPQSDAHPAAERAGPPADTDESYTLTVKAPRATIEAATVFGAMHGLESLSQLVHRGAFPSMATSGFGPAPSKRTAPGGWQECWC